MVFRTEFPPLRFWFLAILASATMTWFGTGLNPCWPLLWFAPLPVLVYAMNAKTRWNALSAPVLAWFLGHFNEWGYYRRVLQVPSQGILLAFLGVAMVFGLAVLLSRAQMKRDAPWLAAVAFPAAWVSFEYLLSLTSIHGTSGNLAYSQLNFLPFLQLASITGPWGMSFLMWWFPSSIAVGICYWPTSPREALQVIGISLTTIALVLLYGACRLTWSTPGTTIRVGLIASDRQDRILPTKSGPPTARLLEDYSEEVRHLAARGAKVIVLPEKLGVVQGSDLPVEDARFQAIADSNKVRVVVGVIQADGGKGYNQARIYAPNLPVQTYNKQHMLPVYESMLSLGTSLTSLRMSNDPLGVAICKDMDFPWPARGYGKSGIGLLLVPAWDFNVDRWAHGHLAIMRGVENGFSIARAAKQGFLTVSDNRGRVVAENTSNYGEFSTLIADVQISHTLTPYLVFGNWFAWLTLGILGICIFKLFSFN